MGQDLCGKWMPRKRTMCARTPGHGGSCKTAELMERQREYSRAYACGICHEPFEEGQLIHVDHDHACCKEKNRSCGRCVRGLLCHTCNIALGHIERRYAMARAYLDNSVTYLRPTRPPGSLRVA